MVMEIITHPNELLRQKAVDVEVHADDLHELITNMTMRMLTNNGVGLSACQLGSDKNIFVYITNSGCVIPVINPEVMAKSGKYWSRDEGCLSVPGIRKYIKRSKMIKISYMDVFGDYSMRRVIKAQNFEAAIIQHELDHLKGKLIVDY